MTLLALEHVSRRHGRGASERAVLREVSLRLDGGELVAVWGLRRSGRSTLLRVAAGIEPPDAGVVRFAGRPLSPHGGEALGSGVGYCRPTLHGAEEPTVLAELVAGQLARGVAPPQARAETWSALERTGAEQCAARGPHELDSAEAVRVGLARALTSRPALLVVDEPTKGVDLLDRDGILALLRALADEGTAVLMSASESTDLAGADRALALSGGQLRGSLDPEELAPVVPLPRRASA
jgi:energy-coupling factor transporter ATP-binding protein EcfA2